MKEKAKSDFELYIIDKVREYRVALKYSQTDLSYILGTTRGFIGQIESPKHPTKYSLDQLNQLAELFRCSPKDFFPDAPIIGEE